MSAENVATVREGFDSFNRGDWDRALSLFAEDMEWDTRQAVPDGDTYLGRTAVRAYWETIAERWQDFRIEADEWVDVDDETVLMLGRLVGVGTESGVPIEAPWDQVWRFRDGVPAVCENHSRREAALRSAGLDPA